MSSTCLLTVSTPISRTCSCQSVLFPPFLFIFCSTHLLFSPIMFQNIKPKRAAATVFLSQYGSCPTLPPPHVPALYTLPLKFVRPKVCEETATLLVSGGHRAQRDKLQELIWHHLGVVTSLLC
uniref:Uncharacterized protein n=1 Tax=Anguilla anguilla TaxID=7936 RepID=A0A0E9X1V8_ANGAN